MIVSSASAPWADDSPPTVSDHRPNSGCVTSGSQRPTLKTLTGMPARSITLVGPAATNRPRPQPSCDLGAQIPEAWLQAIPGVRFTRLTDEAALNQFQHCGRLLWVDSFKVGLDGTAVIAVAEGYSCQFSGQEYRFHRSPDGWFLDEGFGGGFGGGSSGCACK